MSASPSDGDAASRSVGVVARYRTEDGVRRVAGMTRDEVCRTFQTKVLLIARRLHHRLSGEIRIPVDDLAAVGAIGLLEAFDRFDESRGIQFQTFAEYRIRGAMYDALRDNDSFSRRRRQLAKQITQATDEIRRTEGRNPSRAAVASKLGIGMEEYHRAVDSTKPVVHVSLDAPPDGSDTGMRGLSDRLADPSGGPDAGVATQRVRAVVKAAVVELPDRHRQCVLMYYVSELSLAEIAQVFDITVSRVSQILAEGREKLRRKLEGIVDDGDVGGGA